MWARLLYVCVGALVGAAIAAGIFLLWPTGSNEREEVNSMAVLLCRTVSDDCETAAYTKIAAHLWQIKLMPGEECWVYDSRSDGVNPATCR